MKLIYLASPYSHKDPAVRAFRAEQAVRYAGWLIEEGFMVFSPIAHTHPIAEVADVPTDWEYWQEYDRRMIDACDELMVIDMVGLKESTGVKAEVAYAAETGKPSVMVGMNEEWKLEFSPIPEELND